MTPYIKPSSIVHTRAQVEAMARSHDAEGKFHKIFGNESVGEFHRDTAAMLRELAVGVPVSDDEYWFMSASGVPYRVLDPRINQHRAST